MIEFNVVGKESIIKEKFVELRKFLISIGFEITFRNGYGIDLEKGLIKISTTMRFVAPTHEYGLLVEVTGVIDDLKITKSYRKVIKFLDGNMINYTGEIEGKEFIEHEGTFYKTSFITSYKIVEEKVFLSEEINRIIR